jgi:hypothetical protein
MSQGMRTAFMACLFLWLPIACTQAGELGHKPGAAADEPRSVVCDPLKDQNCGPAGITRQPLAPVVPPVPESPLRVDCERLPTQIERDTCTNRKQSTG